jgi:hypothetical protein
MNIYAGLLFNQGHVGDVATARLLAGEPDPAPAAAGPPPPQAPADGAARPLAAGGPWALTLRAALLAALR